MDTENKIKQEVTDKSLQDALLFSQNWEAIEKPNSIVIDEASNDSYGKFILELEYLYLIHLIQGALGITLPCSISSFSTFFNKAIIILID